jgi:hypothetical protein
MRAFVLLALLLLLLTVAPGAAAESGVPCEGRPGDHSAPVGLYISSQGDTVIFVGKTTHNGHWWGTEYPLAC